MVIYFEQTDETKQYFFAYGLFLDSFAKIELHLKGTLFEVSGCDEEIAKIIFGSDRADASMTKIRKILNAQSGTPDYIDRAFQHLIKINEIRNILVHYGTHFSKDGYEAKKRQYLPEPSHISKTVSSEILTSMTRDLRTIKFSLVRLSVAKRGLTKGPWVNHSEEPWLYKPPPNGNKGPSQRSSRKRQRPPGSSRA